MIHAIIEYLNRSYAFVAKPNMAIAIELALTKFKHYDECVVPFDFKKTTYKLEKIDPNRYIPIR
jgi:1-deoxy-D-xylulose 5-phosphate reductoisomerase